MRVPDPLIRRPAYMKSAVDLCMRVGVRANSGKLALSGDSVVNTRAR